jgi:hypothetical protein
MIAQIADLLNSINARLAQIDSRLAQVDAHFATLEDRVSQQFMWTVVMIFGTWTTAIVTIVLHHPIKSPAELPGSLSRFEARCARTSA